MGRTSRTKSTAGAVAGVWLEALRATAVMSPVASAAAERVIAWIIGGQSPSTFADWGQSPMFQSTFADWGQSPLSWGTVPKVEPVGDCPQGRASWGLSPISGQLGTVPNIGPVGDCPQDHRRFTFTISSHPSGRGEGHSARNGRPSRVVVRERLL